MSNRARFAFTLALTVAPCGQGSVAGLDLGIDAVRDACEFVQRARGGAAFEVLRWASVTYLAFLAIQAHCGLPPSPGGPGLRGAAPPATEPTLTASGVLRRAITMNLLNPRLTVFFLAFLPQFAGRSPTSPATSPCCSA